MDTKDSCINFMRAGLFKGWFVSIVRASQESLVKFKFGSLLYILDLFLDEEKIIFT